MSTHTPRRRVLIGTLVAGLVASPLALGLSAPAQAVSPGLVISEVYGAGGNSGATLTNDFIELYNPTGSPISLSGMSVQYRSTSGTSVGSNITALSGTVPANGYFLIQEAAGSGGTAALPTPDATGTIAMAGGSGQVFLVNGTAALDVGTGNLAGNPSFVDMVGYGTASTFEGAATGVALTSTTSAARTSPFADTDNNAADFSEITPAPQNSGGGPVTPGDLAATNPGAQTATVGTPFTLTLQATGGTAPRTWTATGLPNGLSISDAGVISGTPTATGTLDVTATVTDSASPTPATKSVTFTITVAAAQAARSIAEIQGSAGTQGANAASPFNGQTVTTEGVVTGVFTGSTATNGGIYIQTGGTGATDATPGASDAIYVFGGNARPSGVDVGDSVRVTGAVSEFGTLTQLTPTNASSMVEIAALPAVTPAAISYPDNAADREAHESELLAPTGQFTVSNVFNITGGANAFAEIGLASGATPLKQPTDFVRGDDTAGIAAINAENAARAVALDDGSGVNYMTNPNNAQPLPWISDNANPPRVGAPVTFTAPVVLDYRNNTWKFQPTVRITDSGAGTATFGADRAANAAPAEVGGDLKIATFNVLNYFPTTGEAHVAAGGSCTYFNDRSGTPIANDNCTPNGPRGAATAVSLQRQQEKIVVAINKLGASVVSLEELENSIKMIGQTDRDAAIKTLVAALNDASAPGTWAFAPSPAAADRPTAAEEDVIRTGFIYKPAAVELVGPSVILRDEVNFDNAREPLAQAFKPLGGAASSAFGVIVNHFKSKGSSCSTGNDPVQGNCNADRVGQARALNDFAASFKTARSIDSLFLVGDFNSYTQEDPMQVLYAAGYENVTSDDASDASYSFNGLAGSLDHVLGNAAAVASVTGSDIWEINANESLAYQYSRYNYHGETYHSATPWSSSDHNPEVVGIDAEDPATPAKVNLLNINDFHGRIDANTTKFATTIEQLRAAEGDANSLFLSAGDNIGASLFASSVDDDDPTLDVLDALDLATSAVGNHEFDQGFDDLQNDVKPDIDFSYLGANVYNKGTTTPALDEYDTFEVDGLTVGVIGVVTQETPSLVTPTGIASLDFGDPVAAVNRVAAQLSDGNDANGEADVIVAEYHEGAGTALPNTATCAQEIAADTTFGRIARTTSASVDVIFTGHTHKEYACDGPVPGSDKTRPILQTGSYGERIGQVVLNVDRTTGAVTTYTQRNVARVAAENLSYPRVAEVKRITDAALANAATKGNAPVAQISADITTAYAGGSYVDGRYVGGTRDDRASESTLGDLVANALRDGLPDSAQADLGITNPGGLRGELLFAGNTTNNPANTDGVVTFSEANGVLPFANTVVVVDLTGAELRQVLEQQWQTDANGNPVSRAYLQLGLSDNVRVTVDPTKALGQRVTSVYIDDEPLDPTASYKVSAPSFLAGGGDNFRAFAQGTAVDTGLVDSEVWIDYLADNSPVSPDFARQQVEETGKPAQIEAGQRYEFQLSRLNLTSLGSPVNTEVVATVGDTVVGTFAVANGVALIDLTVPVTVRDGDQVTFVAEPSGTTVTVPFSAAPKVTTEVTGTPTTVTYGQDASVPVQVDSAQDATPTGEVAVKNGDTVVGTATLGEDGTGTATIEALTLPVGTYSLTLDYAGDDTFEGSTGTVKLTVVKAASFTQASARETEVQVKRNRTRFTVTVSADGYTPTGRVDVVTNGGVSYSGTLVDGVASIVVGPWDRVGTFDAAVRYRGDDNTEPSSDTVQVSVVKQTPTMSVSAPDAVRKGTKPTIRVALSGVGAEVTGQVRFSYNDGSAVQTLVDGRTSRTLPGLTRSTRVTVSYLGSSEFTTASKTLIIRVVS